MKKESIVAAASLVLGITLILVLFVLNLPRSAQPETGTGLLQRLPLRLAGLPRAHLMEGEEAAAALAELHGTTVGINWAGMAHYASGPAQATVWVGGADTEASAEDLLARMTVGIQRGRTQFQGLRPISRGGRMIFSVSGQGQTHYYFAAARAVVWVSADPSSSEEILGAVMQVIDRGEMR